MSAFSSTLVSLGSVLAASATLCFVAGFVIVRTFLTRRGVTDLRIIRAQHLSAGLLFFCVMAVPLGTGLAFWVDLPNPLPSWDALIGSFLITISVGFLAWDLILWITGVDQRFASEPADSTFFVIATLSVIVAAYLVQAEWPNSLSELAVTHVVRATFLAALPVLAAVYYSFRMYGRRRPDLGGGASWVVRLTVHADRVAATLGDALESNVLLVDRSESSLYLQVREDDRFRFVEVPIQTVQAVEAVGIAPLTPSPLPLARWWFVDGVFQDGVRTLLPEHHRARLSTWARLAVGASGLAGVLAYFNRLESILAGAVVLLAIGMTVRQYRLLRESESQQQVEEGSQ